jgi:hypothetical protein
VKKLIGKRTIIAAVVKLILIFAKSQGWSLPIGEADLIAVLDPIVDAAIWIFLALKGNRILKGQGSS